MNNKNKCLIVEDSNNSLSFSLYDFEKEKKITSGKCDNINKDDSYFLIQSGNYLIKENIKMINKDDAVITFLKKLLDYRFINNLDDIGTVGYHLLHGGMFREPVIIDENILRYLILNYPEKGSSMLALYKYLRSANHVSVFDSSFYHQDYIDLNKCFHSLSYQYIIDSLSNYFDNSDINVIACCLGNTSSVCCIENGNNKNVKMSDITINNYQNMYVNAKIGNIEEMKKLEYYKEFITDAITNYYLNMSGHLDALVFTGEIGENVKKIREEIINNLPFYIRFKLDHDLNRLVKNKNDKCVKISSKNSIPIFVINNNYEFVIIKEIKKLLTKQNQKVYQKMIK